MSRPIISLTQCSIFQQDSLVLHDVNLTVNEGEMVYLIGKTGSGKSSLLKTLYAELPIQQGEAFVVNHNLRTIKKPEIPLLRRQLGIVFQDFQLLLDRTVEENLKFVLKATGWSQKQAIQNRIEEVLTDVGLQNKGYKMPFALSGGEQQRVVIARALLNNPYLLLADEPTGNLDPATSEDIMNLMVKLNREHNMAMLVATHDYQLIERFPSRIVECQNETIRSKSSLAN